MGNHFRKSHIVGWEINIIMIMCICNNKHHVNFKLPTDNLRVTDHAIKNRTGLANHTASCTGRHIVACMGHENHDDRTSKTWNIMLHGIISPSSNELSLTYLQVGTGRGYCAWNIITMLVLAGAFVFGTEKRHDWFQMTFGQILK